MKVLQVIETAYRATIEEQDDTVVWITHNMKGAGAELDVLLRGNAVNYAVERQDASGLSFGDWRQTQPPRIPHDIASLVDKGVDVFVIDEDANDRGLGNVGFVAGVQRVPRADVAPLMERYDQIWHW